MKIMPENKKSFYPDYIVHDTEGNTWILETKGGFSKLGHSEGIDKFTSMKFAILKRYLDKYNLNKAQEFIEPNRR